ncbi:nicotinate-nucleotide adenylyltransferase [Parashewanella tropica]|uniref:nicotinate-nucleotide adenylyltransferase n=1 Tax=Parashewanella tropica TaxID=2547970 RepID=UPI00105A13CA|nr:nicotinate-nucleotide adenylyltransferase [Parashewanella tropica]
MKIGILGGTFDPIHYGHIRPALEVREKLGLDKIWLMPNHIPPHKQGTHTTSQHRLNMVNLVCQDHIEFELCDIELQRETPSYTVKTLEELTEQYPEHQFTFIMGMDSLLSLEKWYQWQRLFDLCNIAVTHRPDYQLNPTFIVKEWYKARLTNKDKAIGNIGHIFDIPVTPQPISSTQLREQLEEPKSTIPFLPNSIANYIKNNRLYTKI